MTIPAELEYFTVGHRPHGALIAETGELTPNGYRLTVACPCGVTFQRWITPEEAVRDLAALARPNSKTVHLTKPLLPERLVDEVRRVFVKPDTCAFCRTPIRPSANRRAVGGVSYHPGCWDRKPRAFPAPAEAPASPPATPRGPLSSM